MFGSEAQRRRLRGWISGRAFPAITGPARRTTGHMSSLPATVSQRGVTLPMPTSRSILSDQASTGQPDLRMTDDNRTIWPFR